MKKMLAAATLVAVMGIVLSQVGVAQTHKFTHVSGGNINKVAFVDALHGNAAADGGRVSWTQDGGLNWTYGNTQNCPQVPLRGLHYLSSSSVWACGDNGVVLRSTNGGVSWVDANAPSATGNRVLDALGSPASLYDIFMISPMDGFVVGLEGAIAVTSNAGLNWTSVTSLASKYPQFGPGSSHATDMYDIHVFEDAGASQTFQKLVIASEYHQIISSTDQGASAANWDIALVGNGPGTSLCPLGGGIPGQNTHNLEIWSLSFDDPNVSTSTGWAVGGFGENNGYIFRTAGAFSGSFPWPQFHDYRFLNPNGNPIPQAVDGISTLYGVAVVQDPAAGNAPWAAACGYGSQVYVEQTVTVNYDPCSDTVTSGPTVPGWMETNTVPSGQAPCEGLPPMLSVAKVTPTSFVATGFFGRILRGTVTSTSGGLQTTYADVANKYFLRLYDGFFVDASTGCVVGQGAKVKRTTDGGATWTDVLSTGCSGNATLYGIDFARWSSPALGVAVGTGGMIAYSADAGATWSTSVSVTPSTSAELRAVAYTNTLSPTGYNVWAVGSGGTVLRSNDGGQTWQSSAPASYALNGVAFHDANVGYVVGERRTLLATTNGSSATPLWNAASISGSSTTETLYDVATWNSGNAAIAVGQDGKIYEKTTSGGSFNLVTPGLLTVTENLLDVEVLNNGADVWISGDNGVVLHRDSIGTWSRVKSETNEPLYRLSFSGSTQGFGIGWNFLITEYN